MIINMSCMSKVVNKMSTANLNNNSIDRLIDSCNFVFLYFFLALLSNQISMSMNVPLFRYAFSFLDFIIE